jgi:hypothetical protein
MTQDDRLAPLMALARRHPALEADVLWFRDGRWQESAGDRLEAEEIAFYAEGLLDEGFGMAWQHLTGPQGALVRLMFWQEGTPALPEAPPGHAVIAQG